VDDPWGEQLSKKDRTHDVLEAYGVVATITSEKHIIPGQVTEEFGSTLKDNFFVVEYLTYNLFPSTLSSQTSTIVGPLENLHSLFFEFMEIKRKNEDIKREVYLQAWGETNA
jgi:hypothetical protein